MFNKLNLTYLILFFVIGITYVYFSSPPPVVIYKFPNPQNADSIIYRDENDTCYKYEAQNTECPLDKSKIKSQPVVEGMKNKNVSFNPKEEIYLI